jgi:hypothetical protein
MLLIGAEINSQIEAAAAERTLQEQQANSITPRVVTFLSHGPETSPEGRPES